MTVGEFIELAKGREDHELTVRKRDKWHLTHFCRIPEDARAEILDVLEQVKARSSSNV